VPPTAISLSQGEKLTFDNRVSQGTRHLIEEAMKLSSRQRPQSVDMFLPSNPSSSEETVLAGGKHGGKTYPREKPGPDIPSKLKQDAPTAKSENKGLLKAFLVLIGLVLLAVSYFVFNQGREKTVEPDEMPIEYNDSSNWTEDDIYEEAAEVIDSAAVGIEYDSTYIPVD